MPRRWFALVATSFSTASVAGAMMLVQLMLSRGDELGAGWLIAAEAAIVLCTARLLCYRSTWATRDRQSNGAATALSFVSGVVAAAVIGIRPEHDLSPTMAHVWVYSFLGLAGLISVMTTAQVAARVPRLIVAPWES